MFFTTLWECIYKTKHLKFNLVQKLSLWLGEKKKKIKWTLIRIHGIVHKEVPDLKQVIDQKLEIWKQLNTLDVLHVVLSDQTKAGKLIVHDLYRPIKRR